MPRPAYFLSYARFDSAFALPFANDLIAADVPLWVDQYNIQPSEHWDRAVESAVRECAGLILILSPRSAASHNVADEVSLVLDAGKPVIPVMIETCLVPLRLTRVQFIDATKDRQTAVNACLKALLGTDMAKDISNASPVVEGLSAEAIEQAEHELRKVFGPLAGALIKKTLRHAPSPAAFYDTLAQSITDATDRNAFLHVLKGEKPKAEVKVQTLELPPEDLSSISLALAHHLGPISAKLCKRALAQAGSRHELCQTLAEFITGDVEKAAFLKKVGL